MFQGEQVRLRAVEATDIDDVMKWMNNEDVTKYLSQVGQVTSRESEQSYLSQVSHGNDQTNKVFTIETLRGEYLGQASMADIDYVNRHAELSLVIGRTDLHGQGYGSDSLRVLLRIAFSVLNLRKVYLRVISGNQGAIRVYQKCGFREAVRFHHHCFIHGQWHDDILMEAFREDFVLENGVS